MKIIQLLPIPLVLMALLVSACSRSVMENQSAMDQPPQQTAEVQPEPQAVSPAPEQESATQVVDRSEEERAAFLNTHAYFDFDSHLLRPDAQELLETKAKWLKDNTDVMAILVEGHCDERGTDAYNMALGFRRAEAVKAYMVNLGLNADRIETQSFGEEKPAAIGAGEEIWAQNRRASFVIK